MTAPQQDTPAELLAQAHRAWWSPSTGKLDDDLERMATAMRLARLAFSRLAAGKLPTDGTVRKGVFQAMEK